MLQLRPLPLLRGARVGPRWWFPNLCCEKRPMGGGGSKARSGKWKNMLIVSSHPIMALATRGSWPGSSGKSIYSRKAVLYFLYMWLCIEDGDTNAAASITDREVCAAGRNMVSEVLEVGLWLVICWRSIFVHCSKISTSFSWLHRSQSKNQQGRV